MESQCRNIIFLSLAMLTLFLPSSCFLFEGSPRRDEIAIPPPASQRQPATSPNENQRLALSSLDQTYRNFDESLENVFYSLAFNNDGSDVSIDTAQARNNLKLLHSSLKELKQNYTSPEFDQIALAMSILEDLSTKLLSQGTISVVSRPEGAFVEGIPSPMPLQEVETYIANKAGELNSSMEAAFNQEFSIGEYDTASKETNIRITSLEAQLNQLEGEIRQLQQENSRNSIPFFVIFLSFVLVIACFFLILSLTSRNRARRGPARRRVPEPESRSLSSSRPNFTDSVGGYDTRRYLESLNGVSEQNRTDINRLFNEIATLRSSLTSLERGLVSWQKQGDQNSTVTQSTGNITDIKRMSSSQHGISHHQPAITSPKKTDHELSVIAFVSETQESIDNSRSGSGKQLILQERQESDNYSYEIFSDHTLAPSRKLVMNNYSYRSLQLAFECQNYRKGKSNFRVDKPANVVPQGKGYWQVSEKGVLVFT